VFRVRSRMLCAKLGSSIKCYFVKANATGRMRAEIHTAVLPTLQPQLRTSALLQIDA
jgi:hypothetical protein